MPDSPSPAPHLPWWQRLWEAMAPGAEPAPLTRWQHAWRLAFVVLVGYGTWMVITLPGSRTHSTARWTLVAVDALVGLLAIWLVQRRRAHPVAVAGILTVLNAVFTTVTGASLLAFASLAARRHLQGLAIVGPLMIAATMFTDLVWPSGTPVHPLASFITATLSTVAVGAVFYAIGSRRAVKQAAAERLAAAEREQTARVAQAQAAERTRIAREMHDVLAHRISLVAMHASALNYRQDLGEEERATALQTIESNAREALTELREILGVLRDPSFSGSLADRPEAPQPLLEDLPDLVAEARTLGTDVQLTDDSGEVPERTARAAYRIVQEALTNARKHAPGAPVTVEVCGGGGADLELRVSQPLQPEATPPPGSGLGLLGLRERAALVGGSLEAGPDDAGHWVLSARLPWSHE